MRLGLRPGRKLATRAQRRFLRVLAARAVTVTPEVVSFEEASDAIDRLKDLLGKPRLV